MRKLLAVTTLTFSMLLVSSPASRAQDAGPVSAVPVPSQITTAKKAFIGNTGAEVEAALWSGGPERAYNEFYAAMKSWGRYELVSTPADADVVMEVGFVAPVMTGATFNGLLANSSYNAPQIKVELLDPKTGILLWTVRKDVPVKSGLQKTRDRGFEEGITGVLDVLKKLSPQPASATQ